MSTLPTTLPPALTKYLVGGNEIRMFSDPTLQTQVNMALSELDHGKTGAVIAHADLTGTSLSIVGKVGNNWTVVAAGYRKWSGEMDAEAEVKYSW